jgi:hypothetical protein
MISSVIEAIFDRVASMSRRTRYCSNSLRKEPRFIAPIRRALIIITPQVKECLREGGVTEQ